MKELEAACREMLPNVERLIKSQSHKVKDRPTYNDVVFLKTATALRDAVRKWLAAHGEMDPPA